VFEIAVTSDVSQLSAFKLGTRSLRWLRFITHESYVAAYRRNGSNRYVALDHDGRLGQRNGTSTEEPAQHSI
jgi:hypothetical protein